MGLNTQNRDLGHPCTCAKVDGLVAGDQLAFFFLDGLGRRDGVEAHQALGLFLPRTCSL